ncbi:hypothetical protein [Polaromonas sp. P5_D5]
MSQVARRQFTAALAAGLAVPQLALAKDTALPVPASLPAAAGIAALKNEPLVLLVSLPGCPFCELVRRNYLLPGQRDGSLHAWQLNISDRTTPLTGFDGQVTTAAAQVAAWKAGFTPTVLFLGPAGQDLAERLVGLASTDFYGAYLEERLTQARKAVLALR